MEFHIESSFSEYNPHLYVSLKNNRFQLCTANAIYSYGDLYDNFSAAFRRIQMDKFPDGQEMLILGFGLGSIPIILEKQHQKTFRYTAVEIDEAVLDLANRYALPDIHSPIEMICADAFAYMAQCQRQFDLIAVDVFLDDEIPGNIQGADFLSQLKRVIKPEGLILYNRLAFTEEDLKQTKLFFEEQFQPIFQNGTFLAVNSNWMLLNRSDMLK